MKKIILSLVLLFGILFRGNVFADSIEFKVLDKNGSYKNIDDAKGGIFNDRYLLKVDTVTDNIIGIKITLTDDGKDIFGKFSLKNQGEHIFIFINGKLFSDPFLNEPILNGEIILSGNWTMQEIQSKKNILDLTLKNIFFQDKLTSIKNKLKNTKYDKYVIKFDKIIPKLSIEKLNKIKLKLDKIDLDNKKYVKYRDILLYLRFKIEYFYINKHAEKYIFEEKTKDAIERTQ